MRAVTIKDPFSNGEDHRVTITEALQTSAMYLAEARYMHTHMPDSIYPDVTAAHLARAQLAAQIAAAAAALADALGKDM